METDAQDYFYDVLQSLVLIHSELAQIRQLLENSKDVQTTLGKKLETPIKLKYLDIIINFPDNDIILGYSW